jgi:RNA polymerase sigma factor (sigma-70 family)
MVRSDDGELYRKHADDLVSLATTLVGPSAAPDVVAAAVARTLASQQWDRVDDRYAYWVRAVVNEARSAHRSTMRRLSREETVARWGERFVDEVPGPQPEVLRAVANLSLQQRTATYLAYWRDLPVSEIADVLGISEGAVRRHLARARSKLRRSLS